jgi:hypothetical protein
LSKQLPAGINPAATLLYSSFRTITERDIAVPTAEELAVLKLLAKEWNHSGPPGIMDISDIVAALSQAPSQTLQSLKSLYRDGLIDMNRHKTSAFLTPEGYAAANHLPG